MRWLTHQLSALLAMAITAAVLTRVDLGGIRPELTVIWVLHACLVFDGVAAAFASFAVGWMFDVMSGHPTGLFVLTAVLTYVAARVVVAIFDVRGWLAFGLGVAALDAAHQGAVVGLVSLFGPRAAASALVPAMPAIGAATTAAALLFHPWLRRMDRRFEREEPGRWR